MNSSAQANLEGAGTVLSTRTTASPGLPASPCPSCRVLWEQQRDFNMMLAERYTELVKLHYDTVGVQSDRILRLEERFL